VPDRTTSTPPGTDVVTTRPPFDPGLVLGWGVPRLRDLPWRRTRDPWRILVAEVMLQQTQVARVVPAWTAFCDRFPDPAACAASSLGDVLRAWQGLGYPRRGRNLHAAASIVVAEHDGHLPDDLRALLALPGIGPYTARAVLAFAFERDVAVVDTNIARVLARVVGMRLTPKAVQATADTLVPDDHGWVWNQAIMDLGATVCRPRPRCGDCPVVRQCSWHRRGHPSPDPSIGSAGVSTGQPPYDGSLRQARGAVLRALGAGPRPRAEFADDVVDSLLADGLLTETVAGGEVLVSLP
jgi:A/G-specific adenine glycosylase